MRPGETTMQVTKNIQTIPSSTFVLRALVLIAAVLAPLSVEAQAQSAATSLPASQATEFMGRWNVAVQTDMGPFNVVVSIEDSEGKVVANVGSDQGSATVTDVSRNGSQLVLKYPFPAPEGGEAIPVVVTLTREGEALKTVMDVAGGAFTATGTGTRAPQ